MNSGCSTYCFGDFDPWSFLLQAREPWRVRGVGVGHSEGIHSEGPVWKVEKGLIKTMMVITMMLITVLNTHTHIYNIDIIIAILIIMMIANWCLVGFFMGLAPWTSAEISEVPGFLVMKPVEHSDSLEEVPSVLASFEWTTGPMENSTFWDRFIWWRTIAWSNEIQWLDCWVYALLSS